MKVLMNVHCDAFTTIEKEIPDCYFEKNKDGEYELTDEGYDAVAIIEANLGYNEVSEKSNFKIDCHHYQTCGISTLEGQTIADWEWQ